MIGVMDDAIVIGLAIRWLLRTHGEAELRQAWPGPASSFTVILRASGKK